MAISMLVGHLTRNWGWIVLRGVIAILFGAASLVMPGITLAALVILWGAYALFDGALALVAGIRVKTWALAVVGVLGIAVGICTFMWPGMTALLLLMFIAGWAIAIGVFQILAAIRFRAVIQNEWLLGLSGLLSAAFGVFMIVRPGAGALAVIWTIAWFAILFGVTLVMFGFRLKGLAASVPKPA